jgi:hypothetical protein
MTDEELLALATKFELLSYKHEPRPGLMTLTVCRRSLMQSPPSWAIVGDDNFCLNRDGGWEYESSPSNRTEDFIERTRWSDLRECVSFAQDHLMKYPTGYKD